ncbi:LADA_0B02894g1_1 [Lachancea dasiensis]|uniref:LADA_0B02894g1_1 n=1 Tax=Lachancea dasiensis TaxID=1072105 RepID=A0A1G4ISF4_9SACH|nr:LADA_0B02894g1_1 [Lachancea dasiensis]
MKRYIYWIITFFISTTSAGFKELPSSSGIFPSQAFDALNWQSEYLSQEASTMIVPDTTYWENSLGAIISGAEKYFLYLYNQDPNIDIAKDVFQHCGHLESLSNQMTHGLDGAEWEPVRQQVKQLFEKLSQKVRLDFKQLAAEDPKFQARKLVKRLSQLTKTVEEIRNLIDAKFEPLEENFLPELSKIGHHIDDITIGRLIGEGIAKKIEQTVVGGDIYAAVGQVADIFADFGTLLTAYATGIAICASGAAVLLCGVSVLACVGGTVVYVFRVVERLQKVYEAF